MRKFIIALVLSLLIGAIFLSVSYPKATGNVFLSTYTYTKAICDRTNFCRDFEIRCQGKQLISARAIEDASIKHPPNWTDPRPNKDSGLCK